MSKRSRDRVFARPLGEIRAFEFNDSVARVFADMIERSVPGYTLLLQLIGLYAGIFVRPGSRVYDLGCSLGAAARVVAEQTRGIDCEIIAVDNSAAMIRRCRDEAAAESRIEWRCEDIRATRIESASLVVLNLTLQFLPPDERAAELARIHRGMLPGGALVLSEKILLDDDDHNARMVELHQAFKKSRGYSELEISQKRNALEQVMRLDRESVHRQRLVDAGFGPVYPCFRCLNFASYLALKA